MYMQSRGASFRDFGTFSLASYPYSLKLLWAPLVDALYTERFRLGQRKSWILPTQLLAGIIMLILGARIDSMFGGVPPEADPGAAAPVAGSGIDVGGLTASFFVLYFLVATQDIAVDGWALTMLRPENVGYASTCNTVGQTAGVMLAYGVLMALDSADFANSYVRGPLGLPAAATGLVSMAGFMGFWGAAFILFTLALWVLKREAPVGSASSSASSSSSSSTGDAGSRAGSQTAPSTAGHFSHHSAEASSAGIGETPVLAIAPTAGRAGAAATPRWASAAAAAVTVKTEAAAAPAPAIAVEDARADGAGAGVDSGVAARTRSRSSGRGGGGGSGRSRAVASSAAAVASAAAAAAATSAASASASASAAAPSSRPRRRNGSASPKAGGRRAVLALTDAADAAASGVTPTASASAASTASADVRRKSRSSDAEGGSGSGSGSGDDAEAANDSETVPLRGKRQGKGAARAMASVSASASSSAAAPTLPSLPSSSGSGVVAAAPLPLTAWASVASAYRDLWAVIRLRHVLTLAAVMLTAKAGFAATDNATSLVMQGRGVTKQQIALLDVVSTPLQLAAQVAISRFTSGPRPMSLFMKAFPVRVAIGVAWLALIYGLLQQSQSQATGSTTGSTSGSGSGGSSSPAPPSASGVSLPVLALIFLLSNAHSLVTGVMFIAQISFFTQVSDPALGGSYMTLLNTVANLGAKWPQYLTFRAIDALNHRLCALPDGLTDASTCATDAEKAACNSAGGSCVTVRDGYAIMVAVGSVAALLWFVAMRRRVSQLETVPRAEWLLVK